MAFNFTSNDDKHKVHLLTEDEWKESVEDEYLNSIGELSPAELYDNYNPGPTLPDGGVNFECHCVSHLVASPCGHEFREALNCQKTASESALEEGACAEELMSFMRCAIRTECFRSRNDDEGDVTDSKSETGNVVMEQSTSNTSRAQDGDQTDASASRNS